MKKHIKKLVNSSLYEDHMIAIEFLKGMSHKEIIQVLSKEDENWHRTDPVVRALEHNNETDFYICLKNERYIAYNNTVWYIFGDARHPNTLGYKLKIK